MSRQAAAYDRMEIIIEGIALRTVSAVDSFVEKMRANGVSDAVILERLKEELTSGILLSELRRFGSANVPGHIANMSFVFARDTQALDKIKRSVIAEFEKELALLDAGEDADRLKNTIDAYKKHGIDIEGFESNEFPEPPPDAPLDEKYMWLSVLDKNTCPVCAGYHGQIKTLREWADVGEPRSGNCYGEDSCRCILIPDASLTDTDREDLSDPITYKDIAPF